jgi:uroporphyrinogen III methyltransferase/synthase
MSQQALKVISRNSPLALLQVQEVFEALPQRSYELVSLPSFGDKHLEISLLDNPPQDLFTRELDEALLQGAADAAVHSAKDLPYPLRKGLDVIALFKAEDQSDALVSTSNKTLANLPQGAKVGTSSPMRRKELLALRPDLEVVGVRGTIEQRISQVDSGALDALIVATCALKRLHLIHRAAEILPFQTHPLQGNLAVVARSERSDLKELFAIHDIRSKYGSVTLVGFGPGDPGLLTLKGLVALGECDAILYDDLLDERYLDQFQAEKIYVGKRKDKHHLEQAEINRLLLETARQGKKVVRLKGGDPMVFAHGGEEVEYLQRHFVDVQVLPGVSTGLAVASLSKVPLTHRGISSSVAFISGHSDTVQLPDTDTVVVYMGGSNLKTLAINALKQGRTPETPVLLSSNVSKSNQRDEYTSLGELAVSYAPYETPLIAVIGNVVGLHTQAADDLQKPTILVTGTSVEAYRGLGNLIHQPLIRIEPVNDRLPVTRTLRKLDKFNWIFFTSRYTVDLFFRTLLDQGKDSRSLGSVQIASIGQVTTDALRNYSIIPDLQAGRESSVGLLKDLDIIDIRPGKVLLPRSDLALPILPDGLVERGWDVTTLVLYHNKFPEGLKPLDLSTIDRIAFASPSCVTNFKKLYGFLPKADQVLFKGQETEQRYYELYHRQQ